MQSTLDIVRKKVERREKSGKILVYPLKTLHRWKAESDIYTMARGFQVEV
jgi:hypothetical protein